MSNQKEYPSTYIAISGVPNFRPTDMPARILPLLVCYIGILTGLIEYFDRDLRPKLFMKDITGWWKQSNADISNWKESGNQVNIVQRWVGCRCISSCPSSVDYDNAIALFSEGGLKLSIGNWDCGILPFHYYYFTRDLCPKFHPISASAKFFLCFFSFGVQTALSATIKRALARNKYFDRDLCPKLFIIDRCVFQSHGLESYSHPEMTEVGTLPYFGVMRVECVGNLSVFYDEPFPTGFKHRFHSVIINRSALSKLQIKGYWKERMDTNSREQTRSACLISDVRSSIYPESSLKCCELQNISSPLLGPKLINGPFSLEPQERQPDHPLLEDSRASQSHVLESYLRTTCVENIPIFYGLLLPCADWVLSLLQDLNLWKKPDTHNSLCQANNCWIPDAVNLPLLTSSLRYPESQKNINFSEGASGISSSWYAARFACLVPDAGNIPLLEGRPMLFETQKSFVQIFYGPWSLATQERQHDNPSLEDSRASQSHILESYFHPETTEVGTLPSLGALRVTGVGYIPISDKVGQKRRDLEGMAWSALHQGYLRGFTAASHVDTHCLQLFCPMGTDGEFFTPFGIAADYLHRDLTRNSRMPYLAERRSQSHLLRHSPHFLAEVTLVSRQKDLLVV